jgi:beta-phosphoglucomutase-like phosphatase (HAD superfamily)
LSTASRFSNALNELLVRHGINYQIGDEEYGKYFVGVSVEDNANWLTSRLGMESSADQIRVDQDAIYTRLIQDSGNLVARDGLYDLLNYLESRGLLRGVATGSLRHQVEIILRGLKIESCFRHCNRV